MVIKFEGFAWCMREQGIHQQKRQKKTNIRPGIDKKQYKIKQRKRYAKVMKILTKMDPTGYQYLTK